jgi:galactan 5-O-arabinofuranosyltransferase
LRRPAAELALALAAAVLTAVVARALIRSFGFDALSPSASNIGAPWAAAMILVAVGAHLVARWGRFAVAPLAGMAAGLATVPLMAGLNGTDQPPYTVSSGDMEFRTEYVTRFASTWHLDDYTFRGLHAFYPPGWFWAAGRTAHFLDIAGWRMMAPFSIATIGAALLVAYALWRVALRPAGALSAAVGSILVLPSQQGALNAKVPFTTQGWYSSYSCFVAVTGVAWLAAAVVTVRQPGRRGRLVALTLVGAVLALTYYLLFIVFVLALLAVTAIAGGDRLRALKRAVAVCGGVAVLTAAFWIPLLDAVLNGSPSQGHFAVPAFYRVSTGIGGSVALTVLAVVAIAAAVVARRSLAVRAVAAAVAAAILYQAISVLTLRLYHEQLQPHRAVTMMWAAYGAAVPVAYEAFRRHGAKVLAAAAVAVGAIFALGAQQGRDLASGPLTVLAHHDAGVARAGLISRFITRTTGRRPSQLTIVSADHALMVTRPYWGFLPLRARYAHPLAHAKERLAVMVSAGACRTPGCLLNQVTHSRFGRVDAMVLARDAGGYRLATDEDAIRHPRPVLLRFRPELFASSVWAKQDFRTYTALVRRPGH